MSMKFPLFDNPQASSAPLTGWMMLTPMKDGFYTGGVSDESDQLRP
jgi:hypothetical protein